MRFTCLLGCGLESERFVDVNIIIRAAFRGKRDFVFNTSLESW